MFYPIYRTLERKREEMGTYQETNKQMKLQLKLKKKGLQTLEALIKENSMNQNQPVPTPNPTPDPPKPAVDTVQQLKYYVNGMNGICIEIESPSNMLVADVLIDVKHALLSRNISANGEVISPSSDPEKYRDLNVLRLMCRGKQLFPESTLQEAGVLNGDSLVAMVEDQKRFPRKKKTRKAKSDSDSSDEEEAHRKHRLRRQKEKEGHMDQALLMEVLNKQQDTLNKLSKDIQTEQLMRRQLDMQIEQFEKNQEAMMAQKPNESNTARSQRVNIVAGDMEDDIDHMLQSREEVSARIALSNQKLSTLESEVGVG